MPIISCESQPSMIQEAHSELAESARLRILIVDDELIVRRSLGKVLATKGHDVEVVATPFGFHFLFRPVPIGANYMTEETHKSIGQVNKDLCD